MSCIAKIKSPINGKPVVSSAYYQLTSLYPQAEGKKVYEAMTSDTFKANFGFDWTKPQIGASSKVNYAGEPKIREIDRHLKLRLPEEQLQAAEQIDELGAMGYLGLTLETEQGFDNIGFEIQMNPKFDMIDHEVISVPGGYQLAVKAKVGEKRQQPIRKDLLERFEFPKFIIDSVADFNNATLKELIDNLSNNAELEPFQQEILKKLSPLLGKNPTLKLAVFDDLYLSDEYQRSFYDPKTNTIHIAKSVFTPVNNQFLAREIIHETIHAFTVSVLNNPRNAEEVKFVQEMEGYFTRYKALYPEFQEAYGLQNIEEFVAEFLSNPYFRQELQHADRQRNTETTFLGRMWNTIKSFLNRYLFKDMGKIMFDEVQETLDDYFDYLMTLQDYPESLSESQIRFSQPFNQRTGKPETAKRLESFYEYVDSTIDSGIWGQLIQNLGEIGGKDTLELTAISRLRSTFEKISTSDVGDSLIATLQYTQELLEFTKKVKKDIDTLTKGKSYYTPEVYLKKLNNAILLAEALLDQVEGLNVSLVQQLIEDSFKGLSEERYREIASKRLALIQEFSSIKSYQEAYKQNLKDAFDNLNSLRDAAKKEMITPVAEVVAKKFQKIADDMKNPNHPIQKELAFRREQLASAEAKGNKALAENLKKEIADLEKALRFIPTTENIKKLLDSATDQSMGSESEFSRFLNIGRFSGVPIVDIVSSFINDFVTEATNQSLETDTKLREINERIEKRNKRKGIGRSVLQSVGNTLTVKSSNTSDQFQGFLRVVPIKYYDKQGKVKIVNQKVYNTPMLEAEFHNDLSDLRNEIFKARRSGDPDKITKAELNLATFLEDYAEKEFVDEYYEADKLLSDDARNARAEILKQMELYNSVFGDDDLDVEITNPVQGSKGEKNPTIREIRAKLRRDYVRLGSIYNEDGTEKPIGSKERDIAESILAYNKARKELDIIEFVIGEDALTKFNQIKEGFEKEILQLKAEIQEFKDQIDIAVQTDNLNLIETLQVTLNEKRHQLETQTKKQKEWLEANTRTEIKPKFFEEQQKITNQIKVILSKYGTDPEITEKYEKLFSAVRGYRDQDGTIQGSLLNPGLGQTIKDLEQSIEDLKKEVKESSEISEEDQTALKNLFRELYSLQSKVTTPYYGETIGVIKNKLRSDLTQEEKNELNKKASNLADAFLAKPDSFEGIFDSLLSSKNFVEGDFFPGRNKEDYFAQESDRQAIVAKFTNVLTEIELNNRLKKTDWYNNNHIAITYEVKTEDFVVGPDGSLKPLMRTVTEIRPIYIWRKTVPNNETYIKRDSPSFDWATPRTRQEYKNPNYKSSGQERPRRNGKDNKYVNEEYNRLDAEEKSIMDDILTVYEEKQNRLPVNQRLKAYVMPNVAKDSKDEAADWRRPLYKMYYAFKSFKLIFKANVPGMGDEEIETDITEARKISIEKGRGKNVRLIKTRYKEPLSAIETTDNPLQALGAYSSYVAEFNGLQKALPIVFALRDSFADNARQVPSEDPEKVKGVWNKFKNFGKKAVSVVARADDQKGVILKQIDDQINRFFYGAQIRGLAGQSSASSGVERVINRLINHVTNKYQKYVLKYNPLRMPKNVIANILNATGNSSKFGLSKKDMLNGLVSAAYHRSELIGLEQGINKMTPYLAKLIYFRAIPLADPTNLYRSINSSYVARYLNADNFNAQWFSSNEAISTIGIYEAFMEKTYVEFTGPNTPPGYKIKLKDAYDYINGVLVPKDGVMGINRSELNRLVAERNNYIVDFLTRNGVTDYNQLKPIQKVQLNKEIDLKFAVNIRAEEIFIAEKIEKLRQVENEVRDQIFQLYTSTQGNYHRSGQALYQSVVWLKLLMTMKSWFPAQASNYYGGKKFNITTGRLDQGVYSTFFGALRRTVLGIKTKGMSLGMDYRWSEREREARVRAGYHSAYATSMYLLSYYFGNSAMEALRGEGEDEEDKSWWKSLVALLALGAFDEYANTFHPVFAPSTQYNKIKTDPLKKSYEKEGPLSKSFRLGYTMLIGQQINAIDKILEGYGLLTDIVRTIPRDAKKWYEGRGTFKEIFDEPYYEISADGYGFVLPNEKVKPYKGTSQFLVGLSKVSGVEVGLKSSDFNTKVMQQVSFSPVVGITNPIGQMNIINARMDELENKFKTVDKENYDFLIKNIKEFYLDKKGNTIADPNQALQNYALTVLESKELAEIVQEIAALETLKTELMDPKKGYQYLRAYEGNKTAAATFGNLSSDLLSEYVKTLTGVEKFKFEKGQREIENKAQAQLFIRLKKQALEKQIPDSAKYQQALTPEDSDLVKEKASQLYPE